MNLLQIVGPVMVGPSSSHTFGAMRISRFVYKMIGQTPEEVEFSLHGSFAKTFKGHGTDRALLAGIMGLRYDDERIKDSYFLAKQTGLRYSFRLVELSNVHPNTVRIKVQTQKTQHEVEGCSIGGGAIRITNIDDVDCDLSWNYDTLIIVNKDEPGALSKILSNIKANIANLYLRRINLLQAKALTIAELDSPLENLHELLGLSCVLEYYFVPKDDFL